MLGFSLIDWLLGEKKPGACVVNVSGSELPWRRPHFVSGPKKEPAKSPLALERGLVLNLLRLDYLGRVLERRFEFLCCHGYSPPPFLTVLSGFRIVSSTLNWSNGLSQVRTGKFLIDGACLLGCFGSLVVSVAGRVNSTCPRSGREAFRRVHVEAWLRPQRRNLLQQSLMAYSSFPSASPSVLKLTITLLPVSMTRGCSLG